MNNPMETFLVGGAVRDQLLNYPYREKDWVVVGCTVEEMIELGFTPVGKDFPVFLHPKTHEEYALARTERKTAYGYKGFSFHADGNVSLEDDLSRRDLTINAMAQDKDGNIIDPYHGQEDIKNKCLRHTSDAFVEDPVRILRVARFAARYHHLGFHIAKETMKLMQSMVDNGETKHLVAERIWQECQKALSEKDPEVFFSVLSQCNALHDVFQYLDQHTIAEGINILAHIKTTSKSALIRFSSFCFYLEEEVIRSLCNYLSTPNEYLELALLVKRHHNTCIQPDTWSAKALSQLFEQTDALRKTERFKQLLLACEGVSTNDPTNNTSEKLLNALRHYKNVDHQALIQQGYQKAALGKAIKEKRLEIMSDWLGKQKRKKV